MISIEKNIARILTRKKLKIAVAESCTGGLIANALTDTAGSSKYFLLGVVAYSNEAKVKLLNVRAKTIKLHGAVSKETVLEMTKNIKHIAASHVALGITGIAGPGGGNKIKPVGTVFIAVSLGHHDYFKKFRLKGSRKQIKTQATQAALELLQECLTD